MGNVCGGSKSGQYHGEYYGMPDYALHLQQIRTIEDLCSKVKDSRFVALCDKSKTVLADTQKMLAKHTQADWRLHNFKEVNQFLQTLIVLMPELESLYSASKAGLKNQQEKQTGKLAGETPQRDYHGSRQHVLSSAGMQSGYASKPEMENTHQGQPLRSTAHPGHALQGHPGYTANPWTESPQKSYAAETSHLWKKLVKSQQQKEIADQNCMRLQSEKHELQKELNSSNAQHKELENEILQLKSILEEKERTVKWLQARTSNIVREATDSSPTRPPSGYDNLTSSPTNHIAMRSNTRETMHTQDHHYKTNNELLQTTDNRMERHNNTNHQRQTISELQQRLAERDRHITTLEQQGLQSVDYSEKERQLKVEKRKISKLRKDVHEKNEQINRVQVALSESNSTINNLTQNIHDLNVDKDRLECDLRAQDAHIKKLKNDVNKLDQKLRQNVQQSMNDQQLTQLTSQCSEKDRQIQIEVAKWSKHADYLNDQLNNLKATVSQRDDKINILEQDIKSRNMENTQLQDKVNNWSAQNQGELGKLQQDVRTRDETIKRLEQDLQRLKRTKRDLQQNAAFNDPQIAQLMSQCSTKDRQIQIEKENVAQLREDVDFSNEQLINLKAVVSQREDRIKTLEQDIGSRNVDSTQLQDQVNKWQEQNQGELRQLKRDIRTKDETINRLEQDLQRFERTKREHLQQNDVFKDKQIAQLMTQCTEKDRQIQIETGNVLQLRNEVDRSNKQLKNLKGTVSQRDDRIKNLEQDIKSRNVENTQLQDKVKNRSEQNQDELRKLQQDVRTRDETIKRLEQDLQRLERTKREHLQQNATFNDQQIAQLRSQSSEKDRQIQIEKQNVAGLRKNVADLKEQLRNLEEILSERDNRICGLEQDMHAKKAEVSKLGDKHSQDVADLKHHQSEMRRIQKEANKKDQLTRDIDRRDKDITEKVNMIQRLQHDIQNTQQKRRPDEDGELLQRKEKELQSVKRALEDKNQQIQRLTQKLAAEMSTKLAGDESSVENVSIKNRPMNVSDEYQLLCSNQWLEAKTVLDELGGAHTPDYIKIQMLSEVFMESQVTTKAQLQTVFSYFELLLFDPVKCVHQHEKTGGNATSSLPKHGGHLSKELHNMYGDMLRTGADTADISHMVKDIIKNVRRSNTGSQLWRNVIQKDEVQEYIADTARICWKMAIQRPPMEFKKCEQWLGDKYQELFWNSDNCPNAAVVQVHPMLYHGTSLMAKGKVLLIDPGKTGMF